MERYLYSFPQRGIQNYDKTSFILDQLNFWLNTGALGIGINPTTGAESLHVFDSTISEPLSRDTFVIKLGTGNIGMGIGSPAVPLNIMRRTGISGRTEVLRLEVRDTATAQIDYLKVLIGANATRGISIVGGESGGGFSDSTINFELNQFKISQAGNNPMVFNTNGTDRITILGTGQVGIGAVTSPTSSLHTNSLGVGIVSKATSYSIVGTDHTIIVTATGQTMTLPTAVGISGRVYTIKLSASGSSTVATTSSQTIDGATTYSLSAQYKYVTVQSDNANWHIIANN